MELTNPNYLWALLGLLIPLAIHLLSRKAGKVIKVGSIRHLDESTTRKFSSIRFNEGRLFAIRALAILLFVLILAGLRWNSDANRPKWVLLEPGLETESVLDKSLDSLRNAGYEFRYFTEGFPLIEEELSKMAPANYPYLLKKLAEKQAESIVFARNRLMAFKGRQQPLPANVTWLQVSNIPKEKLLAATRIQKDTVALLSGVSTSEHTGFKHQLRAVGSEQTEITLPETGSETVVIEPKSILPVLIVAPKEFSRDVAILQATLQAVDQISATSIPVEVVATAPDSTISGYRAILSFVPLSFQNNSPVRQINFVERPGEKLLVKTGPFTWQLTGRLHRERALAEELPLSLAEILLENEELEQKIAAWDQRSIDESVFFVNKEVSVASVKTAGEPLDQWLVALLVMILIIERCLAFFRKP